MKEPLVNVAIVNSPKITFELSGEYFTKKSSEILSGKYTIEYSEGFISLTGKSLHIRSTDEIVLTPIDSTISSFLLHDVKIGKEFHWERLKKLRFRGSLKFVVENGEIIAINIIAAEEYLSSVISSEMSSRSALEFLKAHAIISRSWLMKTIQQRKTSAANYSEFKIFNEKETKTWYDHQEHLLFDVCADDHCQRYQGIKRQTDQIKKAIEFTRGMVLVYDNEICDARYSKCCGGKTESFENAWAPIHFNYLESKYDYRYDHEDIYSNLSKMKEAEKWISDSPEAYCKIEDENILSQILVDFDLQTEDFYRWKVEYTQNELREIIAKKTNIDFGYIISILPIERGNSARLTSVMIVGTEHCKVFGKELEIRRILADKHLYSSAFFVTKHDIVDDIPQRFVIHGAGWGHGVGLCQIGAAVMALKGYRFDEILAHYFSGIKVKRLY